MTDKQIQEKAAEILRLVRSSPETSEYKYHRGRLTLKLHELQTELAAEFGRRHGWRLTKHWINPSQLGRRSNTRTMSETAIPDMPNNLFDHPYFYRDRDRPYRPTAIAAHLYNLPSPEKLDEVCRRHNIGYELGADLHFPSWWYPENTTLILYTPGLGVEGT